MKLLKSLFSILLCASIVPVYASAPAHSGVPGGTENQKAEGQTDEGQTEVQGFKLFISEKLSEQVRIEKLKEQFIQKMRSATDAQLSNVAEIARAIVNIRNFYIDGLIKNVEEEIKIRLENEKADLLKREPTFKELEKHKKALDIVFCKDVVSNKLTNLLNDYYQNRIKKYSADHKETQIISATLCFGKPREQVVCRNHGSLWGDGVRSYYINHCLEDCKHNCVKEALRENEYADSEKYKQDNFGIQ